MEFTTGHQVVVAVDGSVESLNALKWGAEFAQVNLLSLVVVTAVNPHPNPTTDHADRRIEDRAQQRVEQAIDDHFGGAAPEYSHAVRSGSIDAVLQECSTHARMVVVGTRTQGRFKRWFRSSTTDRLTGSLTRPVVSIPLPASQSDRAQDRKQADRLQLV